MGYKMFSRVYRRNEVFSKKFILWFLLTSFIALNAFLFWKVAVYRRYSSVVFVWLKIEDLLALINFL